ncbi:MAG: hypothetical protein WBN77_02745 [Desulfobacterales bacterium]
MEKEKDIIEHCINNCIAKFCVDERFKIKEEESAICIGFIHGDQNPKKVEFTHMIKFKRKDTDDKSYTDICKTAVCLILHKQAVDSGWIKNPCYQKD